MKYILQHTHIYLYLCVDYSQERGYGFANSTEQIKSLVKQYQKIVFEYYYEYSDGKFQIKGDNNDSTIYITDKGQQLHDKLLLAVILLSGLPLRGTEYEPIQLVNRCSSSIVYPRQVYFEEHNLLFAIISNYSKTGLVKTTHYLQGILAEVFAMYHVFIKPTVGYIAYMISKPPPPEAGMPQYKQDMKNFFITTNFNDYLFMDLHGNHFTDTRIRDTFLEQFSFNHDLRITIGMWRHVSIDMLDYAIFN